MISVVKPEKGDYLEELVSMRLQVVALKQALKIASNLLMISRGLRDPTDGVDASKEKMDCAAKDLYKLAKEFKL